MSPDSSSRTLMPASHQKSPRSYPVYSSYKYMFMSYSGNGNLLISNARRGESNRGVQVQILAFVFYPVLVIRFKMIHRQAIILHDQEKANQPRINKKKVKPFRRQRRHHSMPPPCSFYLPLCSPLYQNNIKIQTTETITTQPSASGRSFIYTPMIC